MTRFRSNLRLGVRQVRYEQLLFWRNPFGASFTIGFSTVFLILLAAGGGNQRLHDLGDVRQIQYYAPGFMSYGLMSACFNTLGIALVVRREVGLLKRVRLTPLPAWVLFLAVYLNALIISLIQVAVLLTLGRLAFGLHLPNSYAPFVLAIAVGSLCFTALGVAASSIIPNQDAAGPMLGIVFFVLLFLSGLWFPLRPGSGLAHFSSVFPLRHMILAMFAPFDPRKGINAWRWGDLEVLALWGIGSAVFAVRRFQWEPRRT